MTQEEIINGSKLIAEYLGYQYIPFSANLKHKKLAGIKLKVLNLIFKKLNYAQKTHLQEKKLLKS